MNRKELIPEFHDIGKLIDWEADWLNDKSSSGRKLGHDFQYKDRNPYDFVGVFGIEEPKTKTWEGIKYHHEDKPSNADIFLLKLADHIASSVSRAIYEDDKSKVNLTEEKDTLYGKGSVFKLWKQDVEKVNLINSQQGIRELLNSTISESLEDFYKKYLELLKKVPEDKKPPINITSIHSHMKTAGKIYRFLKNHAEIEVVSEPKNFKIKWKQRDGRERESDSVNDAEKQWDVKLILGSISFPQNPIKTSDLNVFRILSDLIEKQLKERDNILFQVSNKFIALIHPLESLNHIIYPFLENGFYVETEEALINIGDASPTPAVIKRREFQRFEKKLIKKMEVLKNAPKERQEEVIKKEYRNLHNRFQEKIFYDHLDPDISIPICELCQIRPAKSFRKDEKSGIMENLCTKCFEIQNIPEGKKLKNLAKWEEGKVIWVRVLLDLERLVSAIRNLNVEYWKNLGIIDQIIESNFSQELFSKEVFQISEKEEIVAMKAEIRFSVLNEFHEDYVKFLKLFNSKIQNKFSDSSFQYILDDLFCIKIDKLDTIMDVIHEYNEFYDEHFPKFKKSDVSPIKLVITCSHVKFPFLEHWRILQNPKSDVYINLIGIGEVKASSKYLDIILKTTHFAKKAALYKLAQVANISEKFAGVVLHDKKDREYTTYLQFERPMGLGFHDILTLSKIVGD